MASGTLHLKYPGQALHHKLATRIEHDTETVVPRSPDSEYHSTIDDDCPELTFECSLVGGCFRRRHQRFVAATRPPEACLALAAAGSSCFRHRSTSATLHAWATHPRGVWGSERVEDLADAADAVFAQVGAEAGQKFERVFVLVRMHRSHALTYGPINHAHTVPW